MKKILLKAGLGNYKERLNLLEYVNEIIDENGLPVTTSCCISSPTPLNGQVLAFNTITSKYEPVTVAGVVSTTDLGYTPSPTNGIITNNNGVDATLPLVSSTNAGLASPAMFNALSSTTPTNAQIGINDTYIQITDPLSGAIDFVVNGVVEMTIAPGKITIPNILDPVIYAGTPITTVTRNGYANIAGYLIYNSDTSRYEYNNGTTWLSIGGAGAITSIHGRTGIVVSANGDYTSSQITNVAAGNIVATTVQAAINELDTEKLNKNTAIVADSKTKITYDAKGLVTAGTDATATDIINTPAGNISSTTVQAAIDELDNEKVNKSLVTTKGDILAATAAATLDRLAVGTNGQILSADSAETTGLKWIAAPSSAKYVLSFTIGDFTVGTTESTIVILQSVHLKGTDPIVSVKEDIGGLTWQEVGVVIQVNNTGDVIIKVTNGNTFDGKIAII